MENNQVSKRQETSLEISDTAAKIAKIVVAVNDLIAFKLNPDDIISWSQDIERLVPGDELWKLPILFDAFKTEEIYYDRNKGIQNIFIGLKLIKRMENGNVEILRPIY